MDQDIEKYIEMGRQQMYDKNYDEAERLFNMVSNLSKAKVRHMDILLNYCKELRNADQETTNSEKEIQNTAHIKLCNELWHNHEEGIESNNFRKGGGSKEQNKEYRCNKIKNETTKRSHEYQTTYNDNLMTNRQSGKEYSPLKENVVYPKKTIDHKKKEQKSHDNICWDVETETLRDIDENDEIKAQNTERKKSQGERMAIKQTGVIDKICNEIESSGQQECNTSYADDMQYVRGYKNYKDQHFCLLKQKEKEQTKTISCDTPWHEIHGLGRDEGTTQKKCNEIRNKFSECKRSLDEQNFKADTVSEISRSQFAENREYTEHEGVENENLYLRERCPHAKKDNEKKNLEILKKLRQNTGRNHEENQKNKQTANFFTLEENEPQIISCGENVRQEEQIEQYNEESNNERIKKDIESDQIFIEIVPREKEMLCMSLTLRAYVVQIGMKTFSTIPHYRPEVKFENVSREIDNLISRAQYAFYYGYRQDCDMFLTRAEDMYSKVAIILPKASMSKPKKVAYNQSENNRAENTTAKINPTSYKDFVKGDNIDVTKCLQLAVIAIEANNFTKAERLIKKSERICPTKNARELMKILETSKKEAAALEAIQVEEQAVELKKSEKEVTTQMETTKEAYDVKEDSILKENNVTKKTELPIPTQSIIDKLAAEKCIKIAETAFENCELSRAERILKKAKRLDPNINIEKFQSQIRAAVASRSSTDECPLLTEDNEIIFLPTESKKQKSKKCVKIADYYLNQKNTLKAKEFLMKAKLFYNFDYLAEKFDQLEKLQAEKNTEYLVMSEPNFLHSNSETCFAKDPSQEIPPSHHISSNHDEDTAIEYVVDRENTGEKRFKVMNPIDKSQILLQSIENIEVKTQSETINNNLPGPSRQTYENILEKRHNINKKADFMQNEKDDNSTYHNTHKREGENLQEAKKCVKMAEEAHHEGDFEKSERLYTKALRMHPTDDIQECLKRVQREKQSRLKEKENQEKADMFVALALDAREFNNHYVAQKYLIKASRWGRNYAIEALLDTVQEEIKAKIKSKRKYKVEQEQEMKIEGDKILKEAEEQLKKGDLLNAQTSAILSDSFYPSKESKKLLYEIFDKQYNEKEVSLNQNNKRFTAERFMECAKNAIAEEDFRLAKEYSMLSNNLDPSPNAIRMQHDITAAINQQEQNTSSSRSNYGGGIKKIFNDYWPSWSRK